MIFIPLRISLSFIYENVYDEESIDNTYLRTGRLSVTLKSSTDILFTVDW